MSLTDLSLRGQAHGNVLAGSACFTYTTQPRNVVKLAAVRLRPGRGGDACWALKGQTSPEGWYFLSIAQAIVGRRPLWLTFRSTIRAPAAGKVKPQLTHRLQRPSAVVRQADEEETL